MKDDIWSPRDAHTRLTTRKRTVRHFQYHHGRWCLITKRRAYTTQRAQACTNNICLYLIIFIFIKRLNYPLFKLRKPWWKMKKPLNYNFNLFTFKGNVVILLCNQRVQRLKSYWTIIIFLFLFLRVFKLFYHASKMWNDLCVLNLYDNDK